MSLLDDSSKIPLPDLGKANKQKAIEKSPKKAEIPTILTRRVSEETYLNFWRVVWMIVIGLFASFLEFWLPDIYISDINLSNTIKNGIGSFVIGIVSTIETIKFQYPQTYLVYNAIGGSFCSVMTTFGNIIEDTENLMYYNNYWPAPVYLIANLIFSFLLHELGTLFAKKWKSGARFADILLSFDNSDQRIMFELENKGFKGKLEALDKAVLENLDFATNLIEKRNTVLKRLKSESKLHQKRFFNMNRMNLNNRKKRKNVPLKTNHGDNNSMKESLLDNAHSLEDENIEEVDENLFDEEFAQDQNKSTVVYYKDKRLDELSKHIEIQFLKKEAHDTIFLTQRHKAVIIIMMSFVILNCFFVKRPLFYPYRFIENQSDLEFYYYIMLFLNVFGAFAGGWISGDQNKKFDIQWGTFRNNMVSVILIATAHNILVFEGIFHITTKFKIFLLSFISDYCGSESNWAGLINETALLYRNKSIKKSIALKNLFYTLILCYLFYIILIYIVRLIFFFII
ncbi:fluoride export protein 1-related [Anaeramoeba flamelloides]|uniref:Fluoride export protein 1-related n=1 Tax=Anaeramoeba flamelloides TaxID=1746091 RepID=A0AAV7YXX8_9EUKA|nr:fluoride export protein 1-related [Anaeramoeba flamelloides]